MTGYRVRILPRAREDLDQIVGWIYQRSPEGAARLVSAFEKIQTSLQRSPEAFPVAPEADLLGVELRQAFFRTRKGNTYRIIVRCVGREVQILRVRGPGQPPLTAEGIDEQAD
ncbi:MAG: type II toxin-antitoxin system RelE/ParE family toxin [Planctomycetaceae bacterium]